MKLVDFAGSVCTNLTSASSESVDKCCRGGAACEDMG